jgi:hypothetical protein
MVIARTMYSSGVISMNKAKIRTKIDIRMWILRFLSLFTAKSIPSIA